MLSRELGVESIERFGVGSLGVVGEATVVKGKFRMLEIEGENMRSQVAIVDNIIAKTS